MPSGFGRFFFSESYEGAGETGGVRSHSTRFHFKPRHVWWPQANPEPKAMSSIAEDDALSASVAKTPNRVPMAKIEDAIKETIFFTLAEISPSQPLVLPFDDVQRLGTVTVCALLFKNGFVQIGYAAPADPANFNAEVGRKFAREDAFRKAWPAFGFAVCESMAKA